MQDDIRAFMPYPPHPVAHALSGPLSGLTFTVKDLFDVAGYPTGGGNPHLLALSGVKTRTAPVVQKLLDNGARFIGKTHTSELAYSMSGHNVHYGTPRNGAAPNHIPGGSSSGSASAVSNEACDFALGSDTGGSVRTPVISARSSSNRQAATVEKTSGERAKKPQVSMVAHSGWPAMKGCFPACRCAASRRCCRSARSWRAYSAR